MRATPNFILITALLAVLTGCAAPSNQQPAWLTHPHDEYPADRYMVGVATGKNYDDAMDRAIARIAQQIEVQVSATEQRRSLSRAFGSIGGGELLEFESAVNLGSDATLIGIEVVEVHRDRDRSCTALAVLDLDRAIPEYTFKVLLQDQMIRIAKDRSRLTDTPWSEFINAAAAMRAAIERDQLAMALGVLESRRGSPRRTPVLLSPPLITKYEALRESVSIAVVPVGPCPDSFIREAEASMARLHIPVEQDHAGDIQIRIGWQAETEQTYDPNWWVCHWQLRVSLYDAPRNVTIARFDPAGGDAYGLGEDAANQEALDQAAVWIEPAIARVLDHPEADLLRQWHNTISKDRTFAKDSNR